MSASSQPVSSSGPQQSAGLVGPPDNVALLTQEAQLTAPDSVMEPNVLDVLKEYLKAGGKVQTAVQDLSDGYMGGCSGTATIKCVLHGSLLSQVCCCLLHCISAFCSMVIYYISYSSDNHKRQHVTVVVSVTALCARYVYVLCSLSVVLGPSSTVDAQQAPPST